MRTETVCDELEVLGCTDDLACNFDINATEDDGSCLSLTCVVCVVGTTVLALVARTPRRSTTMRRPSSTMAHACSQVARTQTPTTTILRQT